MARKPPAITGGVTDDDTAGDSLRPPLPLSRVATLSERTHHRSERRINIPGGCELAPRRSWQRVSVGTDAAAGTRTAPMGAARSQPAEPSASDSGPPNARAGGGSAKYGSPGRQEKHSGQIWQLSAYMRSALVTEPDKL